MEVNVAYLKKHLKVLSLMPSDELYIDFANGLMAKVDGNMALHITLPFRNPEWPSVAVPSIPAINFFLYNLKEKADIDYKSGQLLLKSPGCSVKLTAKKDIPSFIGRARLGDMDDIDVTLPFEVIRAVHKSVHPHTVRDTNYIAYSHIFMRYEDSVVFYSGNAFKLCRYVTPVKSAEFTQGFYVDPMHLELLYSIGEAFEVLVTNGGNLCAYQSESGIYLMTASLLMDKPLPYDKPFVALDEARKHVFDTKTLTAGVRSVLGTKSNTTGDWFDTVSVTINGEGITLRSSDELGSAETTILAATNLGEIVPLKVMLNLNHLAQVIFGIKDQETTVSFTENERTPIFYSGGDGEITIANSVVISR